MTISSRPEQDQPLGTTIRADVPRPAKTWIAYGCAAAFLMRRVKAQLDPADAFSPGRF